MQQQQQKKKQNRMLIAIESSLKIRKKAECF